MIKKIITLFKLGRKIARSDILEIISKLQKPPLAITLLFKFLSISFTPKKKGLVKNEGEGLAESLESMGTTFIKLGQFLATRPDIIGESLSNQLENLQDKLPPFSIIQAREIIKNDLGQETYDTIINLSEPVAAASNLKSISKFVISLSKKTTSTNFNLFVFLINDSTKKAKSIIASISSLKIFLMFGRKIFIATSLMVPLSLI